MSVSLPKVNCVDKCPVNGNTFPGKLWKLVNDVNYPSIRWSSCGTTVIIDSYDFKEEVLRTGEYSVFKTQNFSSFVRQLNLYGFRKLATTANTKFSDMKNGSYSRSHALHCFAHQYFVQHRPDILSKVRRTATSAAKRRSSFGSDNTYYYRQYGNTFRILSRYGQSASTPYYTRPSTQSPVATPSFFCPPISFDSQTPSSSQTAVLRDSKTGSASPSPSPTRSTYLSDDTDSDTAHLDALAKPSSADILWGSAFVESPSSEEESPPSSPQLTLIAKADKGSVKATRINDEVVAFPSCLYDTQGRLQKFVVIQQNPNPEDSLPTLNHVADHMNAGSAITSAVWPASKSSSHSVAPIVSADSYGYQLLDFSGAQYPCTAFGYPASYLQDFMYLPSIYPESSSHGAYYASDAACTDSNSQPVASATGGLDFQDLHDSSPCQPCSHDGGTETKEDSHTEAEPSSPFKKVVVEHKVGNSSVVLSAVNHIGRGDGCHSPYPIGISTTELYTMADDLE
ncbi:uncharacterized protein [Diadema setosum]|uniref:uncharacterized protein n=1 Tax=Diadema setosum TaxID=31175 RepID=UPI003B3A5021